MGVCQLTTQKPIELRLVESLLYFRDWPPEDGAASRPKAELPHPTANWESLGKSVADGGKGLHVETAQSGLTVILR